MISDRFSGSTLAYQGHGRGLDRQLIDQLEMIATAGLQPDLTLWLTLPLEESLRRRQGAQADRIEAEGQEFLQRVIDGFAVIAEQRGWSAIAADRPQEAVSRALEKELMDRLG